MLMLREDFPGKGDVSHTYRGVPYEAQLQETVYVPQMLETEHKTNEWTTRAVFRPYCQTYSMIRSSGAVTAAALWEGGMVTNPHRPIHSLSELKSALFGIVTPCS
jgi:hypothetical protein